MQYYFKLDKLEIKINVFKCHKKFSPHKFKITLLLLLLLLLLLFLESLVYIFSSWKFMLFFICKPAHLIKRAYSMCMRTIKYRNAVWVCKEASLYFSKRPKALSYVPKDAVRGAVYVLLQESQDFFLTGHQHLCAYLVNKFLINKCMLFKYWRFWWTKR